MTRRARACCRAASAPRRAERACGAGGLATSHVDDTAVHPHGRAGQGIRTVLIPDCAVTDKRAIEPPATHSAPTSERPGPQWSPTPKLVERDPDHVEAARRPAEQPLCCSTGPRSPCRDDKNLTCDPLTPRHFPTMFDLRPHRISAAQRSCDVLRRPAVLGGVVTHLGAALLEGPHAACGMMSWA